ncbi:hypothetical protein FFT09_14475 [Saccharomonospora piscinae]|uniref:hypothetical protein n=1 Tax=Saccharomonospora piscinae TaxID=687388 RepID=UPI0011062855|nr:hypothetical protein [Saccharomonospora piscinae]TLW92084.1 hypothetical protein FFT09_14475 [Saccharomonospora piscinae]
MQTCDLESITLTRRATPARTKAVSLPEAAAWFAGERHSDRPESVSGVLIATATVLGDRLPFAKRQRLKRFVPALVGTADDGKDRMRSMLAMDWLVRVYTPAWLRLVPSLALAAASLTEHTPVRAIAEAADAIEAPLTAVHRVAWNAHLGRAAAPNAVRTDVASALARALSTHAGDAAVAATLSIAEPFLPVCGRLRLAAEQALLIAALTSGHATATVPEARIATLVAPTGDALEDAVVGLFGRLIDGSAPTVRGWLDADPVEAIRRLGPG